MTSVEDCQNKGREGRNLEMSQRVSLVHSERQKTIFSPPIVLIQDLPNLEKRKR